jgi:hypothetical protein
MIGSMVFCGTVSRASRFVTSQVTFFPFISRAYLIFYDIETDRPDFIRCKIAF